MHKKMDYKIIYVKLFFIIYQITQHCHGQQNKISHPQYSLQNMPKTSFSCRDKILGGYYADAETQCQMFHVCVKIAGVGVQDYRFLCPNGTAFDQDAQICGYFGDIDCQGSTHYYGSDNFDLYRIGSSFESKRAPFAEEAEAEFHLQRSESVDARRSKQYLVNQNSKTNTRSDFNQNSGQLEQSTGAPITTSTVRQTTRQRVQDDYFSTSTQRLSNFNSKNYHSENSNKDNNYFAKKQFSTEKTTTKAAPTTTTAKLNEAQYNNFNDEILRGSHSSDFFSNKNSGKENYDDPDVRKLLATKKPIQSKHIRQRGRQQIKYANSITSSASPVDLYKQFDNADRINNGISKQKYDSRTNNYLIADQINPSAPSPFEKRRQPAAVQQSNKSNVQQTILSSDSNVNDVPTTSTRTTNAISYQQPSSTQSSPVRSQSQRFTTPAETSYFDNQNNKKANHTFSRGGTKNQFYNLAYEEKANEEPKIDFLNTYSQPEHFQRRVSNVRKTTSNENQYTQTTPYNPYIIAQAASAEIKNAAAKIYPDNPNPVTVPTTSLRPEAFNKPNNNGQQDNITPQSLKKFSTLVPKESYNPTTFRPSTYRKNEEVFKSYAGFLPAQYEPAISTKLDFQQQQIKRVQSRPFTVSPSTNAAFVTSTTPRQQERIEQSNEFSVVPIFVRQNNYLPSTTPKLVSKKEEEEEEDDGSYRPELYEKDLYKNKVKKTQSRNRGNTKSNYRIQSDSKSKSNNKNNLFQAQTTSSDEDLKTANSLNIAASANELRKQAAVKQAFADKSQPLKLTSSTRAGYYLPTISPNAVTTKKPVVITGSDDYNYEYYDIGDSSNDKTHTDYDSYDGIIQEFAKTNKKTQ